MAFWPSSALLMVTKAKPRGRLVSRSMMRLVSETVPYLEKRLFRSCSVVWKERFPTYNFILFLFSGFEVATSRRLFEERTFARMKYRWERSGNLRTTTWLQREAMDRLAMTVASFSKESRITYRGSIERVHVSHRRQYVRQRDGGKRTRRIGHRVG